jgi:peptide chain release factor 2
MVRAHGYTTMPPVAVEVSGDFECLNCTTKSKSSRDVSTSSGGIFDLAEKRARLEEIDAISQAPGFWDDPDNAQSIMQERGEISDLIERIEGLFENLEDAGVFLELSAEAGGDPDSEAEAERLVASVEKDVEKLEQLRMLSGDHDGANAIVTIKPGAGGTESQDWANMLLRMYLRYCDSKGWNVEITDISDGDEAGISKAELLVTGPWAFGYLKAESGVHRLVRLSPFDSANRRHTSFVAVTVVPEIDDDIEIEINDSDLRIDTYRASGAGGQHVNRTDSAVRITHLPTDTVVACQAERSQHKNRATAMKLLRSKLYEQELRRREEEAAEAHAQESAVDFGSQIRSYVLHPYKQIKDLRTGVTIGNVDAVLDGDLDEFIEAFLLQEGDEEAEQSQGA